MTFWHRLRMRKARAAGPVLLSTPIDRKLRFHIEERIADLTRSGLTEPDARRQVRLEFGGLDQVKEVCLDARGTRWIEDFAADQILFDLRFFASQFGFHGESEEAPQAFGILERRTLENRRQMRADLRGMVLHGGPFNLADRRSQINDDGANSQKLSWQACQIPKSDTRPR